MAPVGPTHDNNWLEIIIEIYELSYWDSEVMFTYQDGQNG